jgi:hypothetical protein
MRGIADRDYEYVLENGKLFSQYGLEEMGMIAQHYYILRSGGSLGGDYKKYTLSQYQEMLPVRSRGAARAGLRS